jgi:hypothetical protein
LLPGPPPASANAAGANEIANAHVASRSAPKRLTLLMRSSSPAIARPTPDPKGRTVEGRFSHRAIDIATTATRARTRMTDGLIPCAVELSAGVSAIRATAGPAKSSRYPSRRPASRWPQQPRPVTLVERKEGRGALMAEPEAAKRSRTQGEQIRERRARLRPTTEDARRRPILRSPGTPTQLEA